MTNLHEDFATLVGDGSFSDVTSDDSSGWMHKIDVSNFKELTSSVPTDYFQSNNSSQIAVGSSMDTRNFTQNPSLLTLNPEPKRARFDEDSCDLVSPTVSSSTRSYPKPLYSYSCLIALALKNSKTGRLQVSEIYSFMCENFPYFRTAPPGWKNSVRHNLSLNKCFEKIVVESAGGHGRKCCLWTLNVNKTAKMEQEIRKWRDKDPAGLRESLLNPEDLDIIEMGLKGLPGDNKHTVVQTLPDLVPVVRANFLQTTAAAFQNANRNWYHHSTTPPRPTSYELHSLGSICPAGIRSPPLFSTPLRCPSGSNSPLSVTSSYSPKSLWHIDSSQPHKMQFCSSSLSKTTPYHQDSYDTQGPPSPWKCTQPGECHDPWKAALAATEANSSLLQAALVMSPCCPTKVTLQQL